MKGRALLLCASGPLLVFSGQTIAQEQQMKVVVAQIQKVSDPLQGPFRPFMEFNVGNQAFRGLLDTGSSDLTVPQAGSPICNLELQQCNDKGTGFTTGSFDPKKTEDAAKVQDANVPLNTSFTGGAAFQGEFLKAPFRAAEDSDPVNLQFGLVQTGNPPSEDSPVFPVIGVGPEQGESTTQKSPDNTYPNIPAQLQQENVTKSRAFGVGLGEFGSKQNGTIIFGGYDQAKIDGKMEKISIEKLPDGSQPSFVINLSSVRMSGTGNDGGNKETPRGEGNSPESNGDRRRDQGSHRDSRRRRRAFSARQARVRRSHPAPRPVYRRAASRSEAEILRRQRDGNILTDELPPVVLIDSGDPGVTLPVGTVKTIAQGIGAQFSEKDGSVSPVECSRLEGKALTFGMGNDRAQIKVPLESMVLGPAFDQPPPGASGPGSSGNGGGGNSGQATISRRSNSTEGGNSRQGTDGESQGGFRKSGGPKMCQLTLSAGDPKNPDALNILGAPAMQRMYIIFDEDSKSLMVAQAKVNATETDIREFIPGSTGPGGSEDKQKGGKD
ncbi:eukaryotic aspartyl protease [Hirsutella rhossiliensis]|uniref:Eukaryotic aspartyl protease domain-containing protein n=1 Tax=Hirsutella rhossiliensis TaxID=111463 RepID=A0A9P8SK35_9HYPO|nr:eukaryotic aspartyl protease domain-containing protein [Hirsutella rhossiliensis]KAH0964834.1 eukaryotic aspartyl protease domain-containing protein [Hirsutella rhossiliensis]